MNSAAAKKKKISCKLTHDSPVWTWPRTCYHPLISRKAFSICEDTALAFSLDLSEIALEEIISLGTSKSGVSQGTAFPLASINSRQARRHFLTQWLHQTSRLFLTLSAWLIFMPPLHSLRRGEITVLTYSATERRIVPCGRITITKSDTPA